MKKPIQTRVLKRLLLVCTVCLALLLTGCYVPPDDVTGGQNPLPAGNSSLPFNTIAPTASPTPLPTEAPTPAPTYPPTITQPPVVTQPPVSGDQGQWTPVTDVPGSPATWTPATTRPVMTNAPVEPQGTPVPPAGGTVTATPANLQNGSEGGSVRNLQQRLKELGYYSGKVDGVFGEGTEQAVRAFQQANRLTVDGKVGRQTSERLYGASAVRAPVVTPTPRVTATPRPTATPRTDLYLSVGGNGRYVTQLQNRLIQLGYLGGQATSTFGGATEAAVRAFQRRAGLWQDGKAGPDTLQAIYAASAPNASGMAASIGVTLREGSVGSDVKALQNRLRELGYYTGSADGKFGPGTTDAVTRFQAVNGLKADGIAGNGTLDALYAGTALPASAAMQVSYPETNTGTYTYTYPDTPVYSGTADSWSGDVVFTNAPQATPIRTTLEQGSDSSDVKALQTRLKELGFYTGRIDGDFGTATVNAVMAFQRSRNLEPDGKVGAATWRALNNGGPGYKTLKNGSRGSTVKNLQFTLYELGYYTSTIDGSYGDSTADAVRAFQSRNGLPATGIADEATQQRLYSSGAKEAATSSSQYNSLRLGDKGEDVLEMKDVLIQLGYLWDDDSNVFTAKTEEAVRLFQAKNGLTVDGVAGTATLKKLYSVNPVAFDGAID